MKQRLRIFISFAVLALLQHAAANVGPKIKKMDPRSEKQSELLCRLMSLMAAGRGNVGSALLAFARRIFGGRLNRRSTEMGSR